MEKIEHPSFQKSRFSGVLDRNLKRLEKRLGVSLTVRGNSLLIEGPEEKEEFAKFFFSKINELEEKGFKLKEDDFQIALDLLEESRSSRLEDYLPSETLNLSRKSVVPKTFNQREYIKAIREYDLVFGIGPAGTGKTYLAMAMALSFLQDNLVSRIILTRPAVEAGEKLGFLPGDIAQKINPYLRPLYDALFDLAQSEQANRLIERGIIEIAPLAYMRGRTLNSAFIILDEAQNTTREQMKMILTRTGFDSKMVITADITQIDLPQPQKSGVLQAIKILSPIKEIAFIYFNDKDVVRHPLVQKIIKAYDREEKRRRK
ncbi:MAG: phosphate starvation-inducible protein PhoH [Candidatus Aminicenantes bacterium]|nr:PhoH family protein [Candidatus Aminicenantes bacterium]OQX53028.1 MAG: phosphate starvation-inducible protein PhoH [Candidatus Aminicenantes bacterium 4484_214]RLE02330.1 MAG: phosphate starvation-inducible protein PhoH [Candidatus Aminicenantes bacterium]HHF43482.1 PhoH family protein [Candidatus Aminicenantes bacterium]